MRVLALACPRIGTILIRTVHIIHH
jgi:hypothetical protein